MHLDVARSLASALKAWGSSRNPRLADLIDRLGESARTGLQPIRAKSAPALIAALVAAVKSKDPMELSRVLLTPWPKSWQAHVPIVEALSEVDDPRIARRLAELVDQAPGTFHSRGARSLWWLVFKTLKRQQDVRQIPLLEAQRLRSRGRYYEEYAEQWQADTLAMLRAVKPRALSKADLQLAESLEGTFAPSIGAQKKRSLSGAQLLEQVWANPTDLAVRSVYGDWLVEQGDPRGELIALQLGVPSAPSTRKIELLVEKHWKKWLGPLSDWFARAPRFEAGFPVAGQVGNPAGREGRDRLKPLLARPEWSTFRSLTFEWGRLVSPVEVLGLPRFAALEHLGQLDADQVVAVSKLRPALISLDVSFDDDERLPAGTWDAFPRLERVSASLSGATGIASGLGKRPLAAVRLSLWSGLAPEVADAAWKELDRAPIGEVQLGFYDGLAIATRAGLGQPFTRVEVRGASDFATLAQALPPRITHLGHTLTRPVELTARELALVEERLARYGSLKVKELPVAGQAPHAELTIEGFEVFTESRVLEAWNCVKEQFGIAPDRFQVGYGGKPRPFVEADLVKAAKNKSVFSVSIDRADAPMSVSFRRGVLEVHAPVHDPAQFISAIAAVLKLAKATTVNLGKYRDSVVFPPEELESRRAEVTKHLQGLRR